MCLTAIDWTLNKITRIRKQAFELKLNETNPIPDTRELSSVVCINVTVLNQALNTIKPTPELLETGFVCVFTILPNFFLKAGHKSWQKRLFWYGNNNDLNFCCTQSYQFHNLVQPIKLIPLKPLYPVPFHPEIPPVYLQW